MDELLFSPSLCSGSSTNLKSFSIFEIDVKNSGMIYVQQINHKSSYFHSSFRPYREKKSKCKNSYTLLRHLMYCYIVSETPQKVVQSFLELNGI